MIAIEDADDFEFYSANSAGGIQGYGYQCRNAGQCKGLPYSTPPRPLPSLHEAVWVRLLPALLPNIFVVYASSLTVSWLIRPVGGGTWLHKVHWKGLEVVCALVLQRG